MKACLGFSLSLEMTAHAVGGTRASRRVYDKNDGRHSEAKRGTYVCFYRR